MQVTPFSIPNKIIQLQNRLLALRAKGKLLLQNGDIGFGSAPSNIAFVKYWGKNLIQYQVPDNPSVSLTLENFRSTTQVTVLGRFFPENEIPDFVPPHEFYLTDANQLIQRKREEHSVQCAASGTQATQQRPMNQLGNKLNTFLNQILSPFATDVGLKIESHNNFPTACGLASSASGMAALCMAIANLLNLEKHFSKSELQYWLAQWARMGSGSAIRSVCLEKNSQFVSWELEQKKSQSEKIQPDDQIIQSTIKNLPYHKNWTQLKHCVFVLSTDEKTTSSSDGHRVAHTSPLHQIRVNHVTTHFKQFKDALKNFDFDFVASFTENDALSMHAVMQTSTPSAIYLTKEVADVIAKFIQFRAKEKIKAFWTLDAGPNIHFLYLSPYRKKMMKFYHSLKFPVKLYE